MMHCTTGELDLFAEGDGMEARGAADWGGMALNYSSLPPGHDITDMVRSVAGAQCPVPHWGYVIDGSFTVGHTDGTSETIEAGEMFHLPPGHDSLRSERGVTYVEFSPAKEQAAIIAEIMAVMAPDI